MCYVSGCVSFARTIDRTNIGHVVQQIQSFKKLVPHGTEFSSFLNEMWFYGIVSS